MHERLRTQLAALAPDETDRPELRALLAAISRCYRQADADRITLSRLSDLLAADNPFLGQQSSPGYLLQQLISLLETTLNLSTDGLLLVDDSDRPLLGNQTFMEMFRFADREDLVSEGADWSRRLARMALRDPWSDIPEAACKSGLFEMKDGRLIRCRELSGGSTDSDVGRIWCFRDVTGREYRNSPPAENCDCDQLTGLPNRHFFRRYLGSVVGNRHEPRTGFTLLMLGLDGFRAINDFLGPDLGDRVLQQVAQRLSAALPDSALLARYVGDEFVVIAHDIVDRTQARRLADNLQRTLDEPLQAQGHEIKLSCSVGIAIHSGGSDGADSLPRNAAIAMRNAKSHGKNHQQFFSEELALMPEPGQDLKTQLSQALSNNEFHLLYQPKIDLASGLVTGVEALIRWQRPDGTVVSPADFIPTAEENGLIIPISDWVLDQVCRQLEIWGAIIPPEFSVAVNISAVHFRRGDVLQSLERAMSRYGTPPGQLELEITEGMIVEDLTKATHLLGKIRDRGLRTAVDDFGTGYSSLNYLKSLPLDILKIDKSFIDDLAYSARGMNLVRTIIQLAHDLDMQVVAEGIESESIAQFLASHGCDTAQGYFFSRPLRPDRLTALLQRGFTPFCPSPPGGVNRWMV